MARIEHLPLFPLDLVLLPGEVLPLRIFEPRYRIMIAKAHADSTEFGIVRQVEGDLADTGCAATVREVTERFDDGRFNIRAVGTRRFVTRSLDTSADCLHAVVEFFEDDTPAQPDAAKVQAMLAAAASVRRITATGAVRWDPNHPWLSFRVAADLPVARDFKQRLLAARSEVSRVEQLSAYLQAVLAKRDQARRRERLASGNGRLRAYSGGPSGGG